MKVFLLLILLYFVGVNSQEVGSDGSCFVPVTCPGSGGQHHSTVEWRELTTSKCEECAAPCPTTSTTPETTGESVVGVAVIAKVLEEQNATISELTEKIRLLEANQVIYSGQNAKIAELNASLARAKEERRAIEGREVIYSEQNAELNASLARAQEERRAIEGREGFCFVKYNGKCFWIETDFNLISCNKSKEMCAARGGTPADIYCEEHYNMIKDYVRRQIPAGDDRMFLWLGMRFNVGNMTASLSDGTPAPFLKWHRSNPRNTTGWDCMGFIVRVPWNAEDQDMYNSPNASNKKGVLCQKD